MRQKATSLVKFNSKPMCMISKFHAVDEFIIAEVDGCSPAIINAKQFTINSYTINDISSMDCNNFIGHLKKVTLIIQLFHFLPGHACSLQDFCSKSDRPADRSLWLHGSFKQERDLVWIPPSHVWLQQDHFPHKLKNMWVSLKSFLLSRLPHINV